MFDIKIKDFDYPLNDELIAQNAVEPRDHSKLLVYKEGKIKDDYFYQIDQYIESETTLVINDAKVIPARIFFNNQYGAKIEVFLLQPHESEYFAALQSQKIGFWKCLIGNKKKWKENEFLYLKEFKLKAELIDRDAQVVKFEWENNLAFIQLLQQIGKMPLPPYIKTSNDSVDKNRYQTVYSKTEGSVAAPTAGLHFTENVMKKLESKNTQICSVTLHVSAGTFLPVTTENAAEHNMHSEFFSVNKKSLQQLIDSTNTICVGTTSVRVTESIYWLAMNLLNDIENPFEIKQMGCYQNYSKNFSNSKEALIYLLNYMLNNNISEITGKTSIMIMPGYKFKFLKGLITNFHQPKSTLLLLISAFVGEQWRVIYKHALDNKYRFLSYGDSSILIP